MTLGSYCTKFVVNISFVMSRYPGTIGLPKPLWITQFRPDKGGSDNARTTVVTE